MVKKAFLETLNLPELISRKISVAENFLNFHTVVASGSPPFYYHDPLISPLAKSCYTRLHTPGFCCFYKASPIDLGSAWLIFYSSSNVYWLSEKSKPLPTPKKI